MKRNIELGAATDERLAAALERANHQITLNNQKHNARQKLEVDLTFATNGGIFRIGPELISFVSTLINMGQDESVLLDINKNPIHIPDLEKFQQDAVNHFTMVMNDFLVEWKRIQKARKPEALVS